MIDKPVMFGITEPMTFLTDIMIAVVCGFFAVRLSGSERLEGQLSRRIWVLAFIFTGLAAFCGAIYHGLSLHFSDSILQIFWKVTLYSIGVVALSILAGTAVATLSITWRRVVIILALIEFLLYIGQQLANPNFLYAVLDYLVAMILIIVMLAWSWWRHGNKASPWVIAGVLVSFVGAGIQRSGIRLHEHFNHNDIYHLVQMAGLYLYYRGCLLMRDREQRDQS